MNLPTTQPKTEDTTKATAGMLAKEIERSTYGVKKALARSGVKPILKIGGTQYYDREEALEALRSMRAPNSSAA